MIISPEMAVREPADRTRFSLAYNFDYALVDAVDGLNQRSGTGMVEEVYGATSDCPIASARPAAKLPEIASGGLVRHIELLRSRGIGFNLLLNTQQRLDGSARAALGYYLLRVRDAGVERFTVGTVEQAEAVRSVSPGAKVVLSITAGIGDPRALSRVGEAGLDAVYLDGVSVNRDFTRLRELVALGAECRLYANMSCISGCPVVGAHYGVFVGPQNALTGARSDRFFAGCSLVKVSSPVEWVQMPWIRPEDVPLYRSEGIAQFKLSDRLASTATLVDIATAYLEERSTPNLFALMERDGAKFKRLAGWPSNEEPAPIFVDSRVFDRGFIEHFRNGSCTSSDLSCPVCLGYARRSFHIDPAFRERVLARAGDARAPRPLRARADDARMSWRGAESDEIAR